MLEGIHFSYDGVYSTTMGLLNCKLDGGMFEETFLPSRKINEKTIMGREKPLFQSIELEPLEFELSFAFEYSYDERRIREVARWLLQPYYKQFYTVDNPNRVFYCMVEGDSKLVHNGLKQGYITLKMRCDSPYSYTQKQLRNNIKFDGAKLIKTITENTFSSGVGTATNISYSNGAMVVDAIPMTWAQFFGKKWSDIR